MAESTLGVITAQGSAVDTEHMTIYFKQGGSWKQVTPAYEATSQLERKLMEVATIKAKFTLSSYVDFTPQGWDGAAWCVWPGTGQRFTLRDQGKVTATEVSGWDYELTFHEPLAWLQDWLLLNNVDRRVEWSMCAKPQAFLDVINWNCQRCGGASLGAVVSLLGGGGTAAAYDAGFEDKLIEFNGASCLEALNKVCEAFGVEWRCEPQLGSGIVVKVGEPWRGLSVASLRMERTRGIQPGMSKGVATDGKPVGKLWVRGGTDNMMRADGTPRFKDAANNALTHLPMPRSARWRTKEGYWFVTDADGLAVWRTDSGSSTNVYGGISREEVGDFDIAPSCVATVTRVRHLSSTDLLEVTASAGFDYKACLTSEQPYVVFQTGRLAGKKIDLATDGGGGVNLFHLKPTTVDGAVMPDDTTWSVGVGDKLAVYGIEMPESYVSGESGVSRPSGGAYTTTEASGAQWRLLRAACEWLAGRQSDGNTWSLTIDPVWLRRNALGEAGKLVVGNKVEVGGGGLGTATLRVTGETRAIDDPTLPTLQLGNTPIAPGGSYGLARKIEETREAVEQSDRAITEEANRRARMASELPQTFQTAEQTQQLFGQLFGPAVEGNSTIQQLQTATQYSKQIQPVAVRSMSMLVGDANLQWQWTRCNLGADFCTAIWYDRADALLHWRVKAYLQWEGRDYKGNEQAAYRVAKPNDATTDGSVYFPIQHTSQSGQLDASTLYYVYVTVDKYSYNDDITSHPGFVEVTASPYDGNTPCTTSQYGVDNHHFLYGMLQAADADGIRQLTETHGYTEILPGMMRLDKVQSQDGKSYLDLANNNSQLMLNNGDLTMQLLPQKKSNIEQGLTTTGRQETQPEVSARITHSAGFTIDSDGYTKGPMSGPDWPNDNKTFYTIVLLGYNNSDLLASNMVSNGYGDSCSAREGNVFQTNIGTSITVKTINIGLNHTWKYRATTTSNPPAATGSWYDYDSCPNRNSKGYYVWMRFGCTFSGELTISKTWTAESHFYVSAGTVEASCSVKRVVTTKAVRGGVLCVNGMFVGDDASHFAKIATGQGSGNVEMQQGNNQLRLSDGEFSLQAMPNTRLQLTSSMFKASRVVNGDTLYMGISSDVDNRVSIKAPQIVLQSDKLTLNQNGSHNLGMWMQPRNGGGILLGVSWNSVNAHILITGDANGNGVPANTIEIQGPLRINGAVRINGELTVNGRVL